jgi:hypothetical protein
MFLRIRVLVMAAVALMACGTWVGAQMFAFRPVEPPVILSGNDVGFRGLQQNLWGVSGSGS